MVNNLDLSTLISQIPEAQRIHQPQIIHPEVQQALAQEQVVRRQKLEKSQIAKSDTVTENLVDKDGENSSNPQYMGGQRHDRHDDSDLPPESNHLLDITI